MMMKNNNFITEMEQLNPLAKEQHSQTSQTPEGSGLLYLSPVQTSNFSCAQSDVNKKNLLFSLICIRFGTCEVRRLNWA